MSARTVAGVRFLTSADGQPERLLQSAAAARHYARDLYTDTDARLVLNEQTRADLAPTQLVLRDLQLLDGAMSTFALTLGLTVRAIDTADACLR